MKNKKSIVVLSTVHLHPLEVEKINEVSLLHNEFSNMIQVSKETIQDCKEIYLVCLAEVLEILLQEQYDFVLFDADFGDVVDRLITYDW